MFVDRPRPEEADQVCQMPEHPYIPQDILKDINSQKDIYGILLTALITSHSSSNFKTHSISLEHNKPSQVGTKVDFNLHFSGKEYNQLNNELTDWLDNTNKNEGEEKDTFKVYVQMRIETNENGEEQVKKLNKIVDRLGDKLHWITPMFKTDENKKNVVIGAEIDVPLSSLGELETLKSMLKENHG